MFRRLAVVSALTGALLFSTSPAAVANHSGAEHIAKGRGAVTINEARTTTQFLCEFIFCVAVRTRVTTTGGEVFSFSARATHRSGDAALAEPHGSMRIDYQASTRTVVTVDDPNAICGLLVICPAPSDRTDSQQATATADVTCLSVLNNRATVGGRVVKFDGSFSPTRGLLFNATDNTIARQQTAPDRFVSAFAAEAPQECPPPSADREMTDGDVLVLEN